MAPKRKRAPRRDSTDDPVLQRPSAKRAKEVDEYPPSKQLEDLLQKNDESIKPRNVLHWFRSKDLRQEDNVALHAASESVKEGSGSLITMYLHSPKDLEWHGTSPARTDFILESLKILKKQLEDKNIPLAIVEPADPNQKSSQVLEFAKDHDVSHIYANMEYEVDELRRDIRIAKETQSQKDLSFDVLHDQTVVTPGYLTGSGGGPIKVFTPYHKAWLQETRQDPSWFDTVSPPTSNDKKAAQEFKTLFDTKVPGIPDDKNFKSKEERDRLRKLWPAGNKAGMDRLAKFLEKKVDKYGEHRSEPAKDLGSRLSPYFAAGVISVREVIQKCKEANGGEAFHECNTGIDWWVREVVFREFYRHMMVLKPHGSMNMPQNIKFDFVKWEEDAEGWQKWCEGRLGVPFVDAGMRQLNHEAYMHNRLRMNVASYLRANLLIDYRRGERYFAEHLVDWDMSNNTNGWEPSYTFFNPITQAERLDKDGDYIRAWVPELKDVQGKAIFAPYDRLSKEEFEKLGYPKPHVDFNETAARAKERYKMAIHSEHAENL
jgi:deoxyribodipyrimidine photo-lyase